MDAKQLKEAFEKHGIRRVKIGGFDVDGVLRGKYVSLDKFWSALAGFLGFCDVIFGWDIADVLYDNAGHRLAHGLPRRARRARSVDAPRHPLGAGHGGVPRRLRRGDGAPHPACPRASAPAGHRARRTLGLRARPGGGVRVLRLQGDARLAARKRVSRARAALAGHVRLLVGARGPERRPVPRHPRRHGAPSTSRSKACTPRPGPASTRSRSATTRRSARPTRPRSSRPR